MVAIIRNAGIFAAGYLSCRYGRFAALKIKGIFTKSETDDETDSK